MYCNSRRISAAILLLVSVLTYKVSVHAQNSVNSGSPRAAVTVLDSTKEQDGLAGSVRRVKIESARLEVKEGRLVEGPLQLLEVTTYGIKGNRVDNVSYPIAGSLPGKEEYKYDGKGNIVETTLRDNSGSILSREVYDYEFDKFGNWTKMVTSLVVFESGEVKHEPVEVTHRTLTYYFGDSIAKILGSSSSESRPDLPPPTELPPFESINREKALKDLTLRSVSESSLAFVGDPPPEIDKNPEAKKTSPVMARGTDSKPEAPGVQTSNLAVLSTPTNSGAPKAEKPAGPARSETERKETGSIGQPKLSASSPASSPAATIETAPVAGVAAKGTVLSNTAARKVAFDYYKTGRERFEAGDAKAAIEAYLQSIEVEPNAADVRLSLGQAYFKLKKDREAVKAFKESARLNPESPEPQYGLGLAYFRMGRNSDAADAFKKATVLSPGMAKAHYGLGMAYQELGLQGALREEYRILKTLDPGLARQLMETSFLLSPPCANGPCR
jgi:hypothetical protein